MSYSNQSSIYKIPLFSNGDVSSGAENQHGGNIVDQQLVGAMRGLGYYSGADVNMVLNEGAYAASLNGSTYNATVTSLEAIISNVYVKTATTSTWSGIPVSGTSYLFATLTETSYTNSSRAHGSWTPYVSAVESVVADQLLLAKHISGIVYSTPADITTKKLYSGILPSKLIQDYSIGSNKLVQDDVINSANMIASGIIQTGHIENGLVITLPVITKTSNYTVQPNDRMIRCSGTFVVTLPVATATGRYYTIKNVFSGIITVSGTSPSMIDGSAVNVLSGIYSKLTVIDGAVNQWDIIG